jgi:hypothetical protein
MVTVKHNFGSIYSFILHKSFTHTHARARAAAPEGVLRGEEEEDYEQEEERKWTAKEEMHNEVLHNVFFTSNFIREMN